MLGINNSHEIARLTLRRSERGRSVDFGFFNEIAREAGKASALKENRTDVESDEFHGGSILVSDAV